MSDGAYRVEIAPAAQRELRRLPPGDAARLRGPILVLETGPRPPGVVKLADSDLWWLRIGDLRIVYVVDDAADLVVVLRVARRSESTYRRSAAGSLRDKVRRVPADESWPAVRDAAWLSPDPKRSA